jgi:Polyketide cyclase / dehydrase and lipid transport
VSENGRVEENPAPGPPIGDRWRYEVSARSLARPSTVWPLIGEAARWKEWSFMTRTYLTREGVPAPDGVGALRRFAVGPFGSSEEVVEFDPPKHLGYEARKGVPARRYRGDIFLRPDRDGTAISWTGSIEPSVPGTGGLALAYTRTFARLFIKQLVRYADGLAAGPPT